jgi:hypothetical protein
MRGDTVDGDDKIELADRCREIGKLGQLRREIGHAASEGAAGDLACARLIEAEEAHARYREQRRQGGKRDVLALVFATGVAVPHQSDLEARAVHQRLQHRGAIGIDSEIGTGGRDRLRRDGEAVQQAGQR